MTQDSHHIFYNLIGRPIKILRNGTKAGLKGVRNLIRISATFSVINLILIFIGIYQLSVSPFSAYNLVIFVAVVTLGIGFTIFATIRGYRNIMTEILKAVYLGLSATFLDICYVVIDKVAPLFSSSATPDAQVVNKINAGQILMEKLSGTPRFVKRRMFAIINSVPLSKMLLEQRPLITNGRRDEAGRNLYEKLNTYILDTILAFNNYWVYGWLAINLLVQIFVLQQIT